MKYEYRIVTRGAPTPAETTLDEVNSLGAEGFRIVFVTDYLIYMERQVS